MLGGTAHAERAGRADVSLRLSVTFGGARGPAAGLTLQARVARLDGTVDDCFDENPHGRYTAGVARVGFLGKSTRLLVGAEGGRFWERSDAGGELVGGYRFGRGKGPELRVGGHATELVGVVGADFDPLRREGGLDAGLRLMPWFGYCNAIPGRPVRTDGGYGALPALGFLTPQDAAEIDAPVARALVEAWGQRARGEFGSVRAFVELAEQLEAVGAPAELVLRALAAAEDEVRHAVMSGGVAARFAGAECVLEPVEATERAPVGGMDGLVRLAVESWVDGCLGEGTAAACAGAESVTAVDGAIAEIQARIAGDEARHAGLAWDVLAWTLERGVDRDALRAAREAVPPMDAPDDPPIDLLSWGCLPAEARVVLAGRVRERALDLFDRLTG